MTESKTLKPLDIVLYPEPILQQVCEPVKEFDSELEDFVKLMYVAAKKYEGIGLAAPQVDRAERIFVLFFDKFSESDIDAELRGLVVKTESDDYGIPFINPEITWSSQETISSRERCLSIPRISGHVSRPEKVKIKAQNLKGEEFELELSGMPAKAVQHEIDHLNGKLYIDYLTGIERSIAEPKLKALKREFARSSKADTVDAKKKKPKLH